MFMGVPFPRPRRRAAGACRMIAETGAACNPFGLSS
jgi:hypothetical protein